jgi:hypothetical protein
MVNTEEPVVDTDIDLNFRIADRSMERWNRKKIDGKSLQSLTRSMLDASERVVYSSPAL